MTKRVLSLILSLLMIICAVSVTTAQSASSSPEVKVERSKTNPYMGSYGEIVLSVTGATNVTYQWQAGYYDSAHAPEDLDDNEYYIGTKTNHFKILATGEIDALMYRCKITYDGGVTYSQIFVFTFLNTTVIGTAYITGVDAPAFGYGPKYTTDDIVSKQYDLDRMVWYGPINESSEPLMKSDDVYLEGKYKCRFYLDPAQGYVFNENSKCSVDGIICDINTETKPDGTIAYYADRVYTVSYKGNVPAEILDFEWRIPSATNPNVNLGDAYLGTDSMDITFAFEIKDLPRSMVLTGYTAYGTTNIRCDEEIVYSANSGDSVNLKDVATEPGKYYIYYELFLLDPEENQIDTGFVRYVVDVWTPIRIMNLSVEVDEPVAGLNAEIAFLNKTENCVVNNMYWYDITEGERVLLKQTDTFEAGHTYQVEMWLKANDGYYMNTDRDGYVNVNARINDKPAEVLLESSDKVAGFTMDFTIPEDSTNPSNPTDPTEPSTGGEDNTTDPSEPSTGGEDNTTDPSEPSTGGEDNTTDPSEPSTGGEDNTTDPTEPSTGGENNTTDSTEPSTGGEDNTTDSTEPSTGGDDNPTDSTEPSTGGEDKPTTPDAIGLLGDANCDGKVNIKDATEIQKHIAGLVTLSETGLTLADVDNNSNVNVKDATAIQKHIAGMETAYLIGEPLVSKENN